LNTQTEGSLSLEKNRPSGICYLIGRLDHAVNRRIRDALTPLGLSVAQYTAMSFLESQAQISNAQLAERSLISPQSANEMIKLMEKKGWVERRPDPTHGRIVRLSLTPTGQSLLDQAHEYVARLETGMLNKLSAPQRNTLHQNLRQVLHALSAIMIDPALSDEVRRGS
jgi:DNA-binding MarR family transcriptional regulator